MRMAPRTFAVLLIFRIADIMALRVNCQNQALTLKFRTVWIAFTSCLLIGKWMNAAAENGLRFKKRWDRKLTGIGPSSAGASSGLKPLCFGGSNAALKRRSSTVLPRFGFCSLTLSWAPFLLGPVSPGSALPEDFLLAWVSWLGFSSHCQAFIVLGLDGCDFFLLLARISFRGRLAPRRHSPQIHRCVGPPGTPRVGA